MEERALEEALTSGGARSPAACVELNETPRARESDGVVPRSEHHNDFAHVFDRANKHLLPPDRGSVKCGVLAGGYEV